MWWCLCDCGKEVAVYGDDLTSGNTKSCGCFKIDKRAVATPNLKHGWKGHPLYVVYRNMLKRCYNPTVHNYQHYGGRGIEVCQSWRDNLVEFINFALASGWKHGLEIDRIDNNGNYEPSNCRFVTRSINQKNKRR